MIMMRVIFCRSLWDPNGNYEKTSIHARGGSRNPATAKTVEDRLHYLKLEGKETFKVAVTKDGGGRAKSP